MFKDYATLVMSHYEQKKNACQLSLNLTHPTTTSLRNECLMFFKRCRQRADIVLLKSFFECQQHEDLHPSKIRLADADKFKPLLNFIRKKTLSTHEKNIELLACLIDFEQRPYSRYFQLPDQTTKKQYVPATFPITKAYNKTECFNQKDREHALSSHFLVDRNVGLMKATERAVNQDSLLAMMVDLPDSDPFTDLGVHKEVVLEYPSGVKISVYASDIDLIAKLVKL